MHEPTHYDLPNHLARIFESQGFAEAAKEVGRTVDAFRHDVTAELKKLIEDRRRVELRTWEDEATRRVLTTAASKSLPAARLR